jgi:hypothetical protein
MAIALPYSEWRIDDAAHRSRLLQTERLGRS